MMTNETPEPSVDDYDPLIPPYYLIFLAVVGLIVALAVALTQPEFTVVGWGGLGLALLSLLAWVLLAPQEARALLTGRTVRFGGTALLVTAIFMTALVAIYAFVKGQSVRLDLTQTDSFSLTAASRQEVAAIGADPTTAPVRILAFYGINQAGTRDRHTVLFEDYAQSSAGKISYEFIDPDRNPLLAQQYEVTRGGQIVVVRLNDDGEPDLDSAELVNFFNQEDLTNAILRVSISGDFRAYFLSVEAGLQLDNQGGDGLSALNNSLVDSFKWMTQEVSFFDFASTESDIQLDDPDADGLALVIPGGLNPLPEEQLQTITDYVDSGGDLVLFAAFNSEGPSLATDENLSNYLSENFGVHVSQDIVLDLTQSSGQTPLLPVAIDFGTHFVTEIFQDASMIFEAPYAIEIADELPENVTVTALASSSAASYAKNDIEALLAGDVAPTEEDPTGPFVLAAAAENRATGARIVIYGSQFIATNQYELASAFNVRNLDAALRSIAWVTGFDEFFSGVPQLATQFQPQDQPIFALDQEVRNINFITIILLPFGVLGIGLWVWWNNRERDPNR